MVSPLRSSGCLKHPTMVRRSTSSTARSPGCGAGPASWISAGGENGRVQDELNSRDVLVLVDHADADGTLWRAITVDEGSLILSGHDTGPGVERILGCREYEFERALTPAETSRLRDLLGVAATAAVPTLLHAVADRFSSVDEFEAFLEEHGIAGAFWSQLGE